MSPSRLILVNSIESVWCLIGRLAIDRQSMHECWCITEMNQNLFGGSRSGLLVCEFLKVLACYFFGRSNTSSSDSWFLAVVLHG